MGAYLKNGRDQRNRQSGGLYSAARMGERFCDFLDKERGGRAFSVVTDEDVKAFVSLPIQKASGRKGDDAAMAGDEPSPNTRKNRTTNLRALFRWLHETGRIPSNPTLSVDVPATHPTLVIPPNEELWAGFWTGVVERAESDPSDEADADCVGFGLGYFCGLREIEAVGTRAAHLKQWGNLVGFMRKGGHRNRPIPWLSCVRLYGKQRPDLIGGDVDTFVAPLRRLIKRHPKLPILQGWQPKTKRARQYERPDGYLSTDRFNRRLVKALGAQGYAPDAFTPHDLRRGFATNLDGWGVPLKRISQLMGHSNTSVTETYIAYREDPLADMLDDDEDLSVFSPINAA